MKRVRASGLVLGVLLVLIFMAVPQASLERKIFTVAGTGATGVPGDGGLAINANVFPSAIAFDDATGEWYVSDLATNSIRKVDTTLTGPIITTIASGFNGPQGLAVVRHVDGDVLVYVADTQNHLVRRIRINATVTIEPVAGTGNPSDPLGDGGAATSAGLNAPAAVAVSTDGVDDVIYIADSGNNRVRRVIGGLIETVAGGPGSVSLSNPSGLAIDPIFGLVYIADSSNHMIRRFDPVTGTVSTVAGTGTAGFGGDGGAAIAASFNNPTGVAVDFSGAVFVADTNNHRIRRIDSGTGDIETFAGTGVAGFNAADEYHLAIAAALNAPRGVAVSPSDELYVADTANLRVRVVTSQNQQPKANAGPDRTVFAGHTVTFDGSASFDPDGTIVFYDWDFGDGSLHATGTSLTHPMYAFTTPGIYIVTLTVLDDDSSSGTDTAIITVVPAPNVPPVANAGGDKLVAVGEPVDFSAEASFDPDDSNRSNLSFDWDFNDGTTASGELATHTFETTGTFMVTLTVTDGAGDIGADIATVVVVDPTPAPPDDPYRYLSTIFGGPASPLLPFAVAYDDADGALYVAEGNRVGKVNSGIITTVAGTGVAGFSDGGGIALNARLNSPGGLAVVHHGTDVVIYVADTLNHRMRRINLPAGTITTVAGSGTVTALDGSNLGDGGPSTAGTFNKPVGVAVLTDALGDDTLYIADSGNNRIRRVRAGLIDTVAGNGTTLFTGDGGPAANAGLKTPTGVAVDTTGVLYISDTEHRRVRKVATSGIISTVAGNGSATFNGDGGPATSKSLVGPFGLKIDASGAVYITDQPGQRIWKLHPTGVIETFAGTGVAGFDEAAFADPLKIPAEGTKLNTPFDVAVSNSGDLYIADTFNHAIRRVRRVPPPPTDTTPPTVTCPAPTTISADATSGKAAVPDITATVIASDDSGVAPTITQSPAAGTLLGVGTHTITVTATDAAGNSRSCTTTLTIVDTTAPAVSCPAPTTISADAAGKGAVPNVIAGVTASDNVTPAASLTITQSPAAGTLLGVGTHTITVTATDEAGNSGTCTTTVTIADTTPPTLSCPLPPAPITADGTGHAPAPNVLVGVTASDNVTPAALLTITQSPTAGTLLAAGTHTITVTATDAAGNFRTCTTTITIVAITPPSNSPPICSAATASPSSLWPPNHKFVPIVIRGVTDPNGDPITLKITRILQDEPTFSRVDADDDDDDCDDEHGDHERHRSDDDHGSGHTPIDGFSFGPVPFVRAERSGNGDGRVYEIRFTADDGKGGTCSGTVFVGVPHDQNGDPAVDSKIRYDSTVPGGPPLAGPEFNLPPTYNNPGNRTTRVGTAVTLATDAADPNLDPLMYTDKVGANGTLPTGLSINASTGKITGTPTVPGVHLVKLTVSDPFGGSASVAFTWTIVTNKPPVAKADTASTFSGQAVTVTVLSNDSDPDGGTLKVIAATAGAKGTTTINMNRTITYKPMSGFVGSDMFTYAISDGQGGTATATVTVTVKAHSKNDGCDHDERRDGHRDGDGDDHDKKYDRKRGDR